MRKKMPRFFVDSVEGDFVEINGEDARHIALSLRMKNGEHLVLCDGKVSGIVDGRKTTKEEVGLLMTSLGGKKGDKK